jgi:hypothetical protein
MDQPMNQLSSRLTGLFLYIIYPAMCAEVIYIAYTLEPSNTIGLAFAAVAIAITFFFFRKVRIIHYDDSFLYVRNLSKVEKISMSDVSSVNTPDARGDIIFEIELRSGRIIEFIPNFQPPTFFWQKSDIPGNVRRFQTFHRNFERKQSM